MTHLKRMTYFFLDDIRTWMPRKTKGLQNLNWKPLFYMVRHSDVSGHWMDVIQLDCIKQYSAE